MNLKLGLIGAGILGLAGCASTGQAGRGGRDFAGFDRRAAPSVVAGEARVVDTKINPLTPVRASSEGGSLTLRFGRPRHGEAVAHLEPSTLEPMSIERSSASEDERRGRQSVTRVLLDGGRFIVCWKHGDAESGYRAFAQTYAADGTALGAPSVISPPEVDVVGVPQVVTTDGQHAFATFTAAADGSFELLAVPLEGLRDTGSSALTARR